MSNNMKLIMENWRKFSNDLENLDKSKILIETNEYKSDLQTLIFEYRTGKLLKEQYEKILYESIILEQEAFQNEALGDVVDKVKSAVTGAVDKVNNFLLSQFIKLQQLVGSSVVSAAKATTKFAQFIIKFKKDHPVLYEIAKIILIALAAYIAYKFMIGTAKADVVAKNPMAGIPGELATKKYSPENSQHILGMIKYIAQQDETGELKGVAEMIARDIASGKTIDASSVEGYQEVLDMANQKLIKAMASPKAAERFGKLSEIGQNLIDQAKEDLTKAGKELSQTVASAGDATSQAGASKLGTFMNISRNKAELLKVLSDIGITPEKASEQAQSTTRKILQHLVDIGQLTADQAKKYSSGPSGEAFTNNIRNLLAK